jgi:hypothetical protein
MSLSSKDVNQRLRTSNKLTIKRFVQNLVNIYNDNWCYIIQEELARQVTTETFKKYQFLISQELNVLKRVVNDLSVIYKEPAKRRAVVEASEVQDDGVTTLDVKQELDIYQEALEDTNKDEALQTINKYTNLSNNTMLKITYRDGKLDYDVLLFNNVEIYTNPDDWKEITAIKYYNGLTLDEFSYCGKGTAYGAYYPAYVPDSGDKDKGYGGNPVQDYHSAVVWVKEDTINDGIIENGKTGEILEGGYVYTITPSGDYERVVKREEIPYLDENGEPILPFVLYNREYPIDKLLNFTTGNDIRDLTVNMAILLIYLNSVEKYQSFKQLVINTDDPESLPNDLTIGPADIVVNPTKEGGGSVEVLDLQTDIKTKYELIKERIVNVLTGYGISPQNFTMSGSPTSGFALKISNIGKLESREAQLPLYRNREKQIFDIERIVYNYHNTEGIPDEAELEVDFAEISFPKSPQEQITQDEFDLRHNVITEIDIMQRKNPDLTDEMAIERHAKNKQFNEMSQPQTVELNPIQQPGVPNAKNKENQNQNNPSQRK